MAFHTSERFIIPNFQAPIKDSTYVCLPNHKGSFTLSVQTHIYCEAPAQGQAPFLLPSSQQKGGAVMEAVDSSSPAAVGVKSAFENYFN